MIQRISIFEDLERYGNVDSFNWKIPKEILDSNKKIIAAWLRAFFDGDGSVEFDIKEGHYRILAYSVNLKGLKKYQKH